VHKFVLRVTVIAAAVGLVQLAPVPMAWSAPATRIATVRGAVLRGGADLSFPASHLGVRWRGDEEAVVEVRWDGGPWQPVHHNEDMTSGDAVFADLVGVDGAERVEARVVAGDARDVQVVAIDTRHGPRRWVRAGRAGSPATASMSDARVPQPGVVTRAQWGADESIRNPEPPSFAPLRKLIVHHTDTPNGDPDPAATVRAVYTYHVKSRGWNDIGYNFLVDERGRIYEGRYSREYGPGEIPTGEDRDGRGVIGAHAEGANTGSVGVALLGTFTAQGPTAAAVEALQAMLAWKADRHSINVLAGDSYPNLAGHRDTKATSCPGDRLYDRLPELRRRVADTVASAHGLTKGYWVTTNDGQVLPFGEAGSFGSMAGQRLNSPVLGMAASPSHAGYWLLAADGGIFSFGDARFHGSTGNIRLNKPVVGMASTPSGQGYWLVASDGGIFAFGDAGFYGSTGAIRLNKPVVGMAATASGRGYWLVASDGGIFAFGDAVFRGSTGAIRLNSPIVGMSPAADGTGYWLVAADGGVFAFDVPYHGSVPGLRLPSYAGSVSLRSTSTDLGYYILGSDGGVFTFGDAKFLGARSTLPARARDMALIQPAP
jgi:hypothetical protein